MPDPYGRPTIHDFTQLGDAFGRSVQDMQQADDRRTALETRDRVQNYLNKMSRGEAIDPKDPSYQYIDHLAAQAITGRQALADESLRAKRLEVDAAAATANQVKIDAAIGGAQVSYFAAQKEKDPDKRKALENETIDKLLPIYEMIPDGGTFVRWKDKDRTVMVFKDTRGKEIEHPAPSVAQAMNMAVSASRSYVQKFAQTKDSIRAANAEQLIKASTDPSRRMSTSAGKEAVYMPILDMSTSGEIVLRQTWSDPKTGKVIKGFDPDTGKEVKSNLDFRPQAYWQTVSTLDTDERKAWDKAVVSASKAWENAVKEGLVDPATSDSDQWQRDYTRSYYLRLRPGAKLPPGFETGAGGADVLGSYISEVFGKGMSGDGMMAAHGPGAAQPPTAAAKPSGIVPQAQAQDNAGVAAAAAPAEEKPAIRPELPANPAAWNVQETRRDGRVIPMATITTPTGQVQQIELTAEEYVFWLTNKDQNKSATIGDAARGIANASARSYARRHQGAKGPKGERTY